MVVINRVRAIESMAAVVRSDETIRMASGSVFDSRVFNPSMQARDKRKGIVSATPARRMSMRLARPSKFP